ncbi:outer membrane receptor protein involved in Fe transport [Maribacter spongiicola]|uniref:Outer membrane receptor protein involved in Fe transport n=1 Tax=Maribacter spongiicola TaxID=1206753 RepID=A0A4V3ERI6_9FLAO|nr:TonB-dependent receptor [Maribacter spongiicola]TDT46283.1 outer membrane receptor protein involved in Fe transport [Maribacter spongiicola]
MKLKSTILFIALLITAATIAQNTITGIITDTTEAPLSFANIILYEVGKEKAVTGVISNEIGTYFFENIANGNYVIEVSVLGFETKKSDEFQLPQSKLIVDFILNEEAQNLDEVVVKSRRPQFKQTAEKLIVDLENSDMVNTNLQDVVKKVPGIIMTNGNVSYAGQGNIRILINGKTTDYMDTASLLRDLPADNISKVELIQQPGSEYDAEGSGPILNIILKKNIRLGTHGNVKQMVGYENRFEYATSASIASYKNKLNWQLSTGYQKSTSRDDLTLSRKVLDDTYKQISKSAFDPRIFNVGAGIDYYLSDKHTIGINGRLINNDSDRVSNNNTTISNATSNISLFTDNSFDRNRNIKSLNPYYEFKDDKSKLVLDYNYVDYTYDNENNLYQVGTSTQSFNNRRYFQDASYKINTYKTDYKRTVNDNFSWDAGVKFSDVKSDSDLQSLTEDDEGVFQFRPAESNRFLVNETILALYSKMNVKVDKWTFSGGLRWEESDTQGTATTTGETRTRKISKLFPSASISRKITNEISANLAYSYRIQRPSYSSLNSFVYFYDPFTFEEGNPNLKPSFTNSYQFNLTFDNQPFFNINYRETSDQLFEIITQNDVSAETSRTMINLAENKNWSFSFFAPLDFIEGIDGYFGVQANHNAYNSENLEPKLNLSKWSITGFAGAEYELPWEINSEVSTYYTSGGLEGIIEYDWLAGIDIAFSKSFLDDKLKVSLEFEELIQRPFNGVVKYDNVNATIVSNWARNNVFLQLNYSFGSKFGKNNKRENSSKDEQNRIKQDN